MNRYQASPLFIFLAFVINALLFLLIHQLVSNKNITLPEFSELSWVDFIQLEQQPETRELEKKKELPDEPPPPEKVPETPELVKPDIQKPVQPEVPVPSPNIDIPLSGAGIPYLGDYLKSAPPAREARPTLPEIATDILPTTRVEPVYPPRALRAGIEGTVTVEFTIATDGSVKDLEIVSANPPEIFDRAVLNAVKRWKFSPEKVDGKPVEQRARQDIRFSLQQ